MPGLHYQNPIRTKICIFSIPIFQTWAPGHPGHPFPDLASKIYARPYKSILAGIDSDFRP